MKNKRLYIFLAVVAGLLLIPLIAMQFTDEVKWSAFDFLLMAILLTSTAFICELALRKIKQSKYRIAICISAIVLFLLIWAELAVGIFNSPIAGQ